MLRGLSPCGLEALPEAPGAVGRVTLVCARYMVKHRRWPAGAGGQAARKPAAACGFGRTAPGEARAGTASVAATSPTPTASAGSSRSRPRTAPGAPAAAWRILEMVISSLPYPSAGSRTDGVSVGDRL